MPDTGPVVEVFNQDVLRFVQSVNRYIEEMASSQSANVSGLQPADRTRLLSYVAAMRRLRDWIVAQPVLDMPETHPRRFKLEADPEVGDLENDDVAALIRMLEGIRIELVNSQSARLSSTFMVHDEKRVTALIDKLEKYVTDYIDGSSPLDLPESSPQEAAIGPGRGGIG